ncbi:MAG TPA: sialidase family protein [Candidatus Thermoplasmatota archaeon]|nr:sialidase family protein [Candidatus Thermoplasmatota archaeon]
MTRGALLLVVALLASGCLGATVDLTPLSATIETFDGAYTFPPPVAYDASGAPLDAHALLSPDAMPIGIEQMVPGIGGEPNLGVTSSGAIFVTTLDQVRRTQDQGRTWETVWDLVPPGNVTDDLYSTSDPMLWVDPDTDRVFVNQMHPGLQCTYMAWSDDDGATWFDRPLACSAIPGIDHQKVMTAKPRLPVPTAGYPNVVYVCNNKRLDVFGLGGMGTSCFMSRDGGLTYPIETQAYVNDQLCGNVNGHPAAFPDGTVAMVMGNLGRKCDRPFTVVLSQDDGLTWQARQCDPELGQLEIDADMTVTPDGTAYVLLRDEDQIAHLVRSRDMFATCEHWRVSPPDNTLNVFAGITSGDDGRIAMLYLGTSTPQEVGATPSNATPGSVWHAYVTTSHDAESDTPTFVTQQVTPDEDPVQVGCIWLGGGGGGPFTCRNLLDFIDIVHDADGRWYAVITDGCNPRNGCTGSPEQSDFQSRDREVALIAQERGASLFADRGILPPLGLTPPMPLER